MATKAIAGLIVVGLAIGVWLLWPRGESASPVSTTVLAVEPTTTRKSDTTTSTTPTSTTVVNSESHVVETVEEAEEILRELWFGWFEGIYNQDEDRIREVVATDHQFDLAASQFGKMTFDHAPLQSDLAYSKTEILRADEECLAVWTTTSISGFASRRTADVHVIRWRDGEWRFFSLWAFRNDLWEGDCASQFD